MAEMRVKAFTRLLRAPRGYGGFETVYYQQLQEHRWWGWKTIDEEIVPMLAKISAGCFGDADSDELAHPFRHDVARVFRDDVAHRSGMISPRSGASVAVQIWH